MVAVKSRFQENLKSTGLIPPGARVLVGYSGGADSTCLLELLVASGVDVVAAHLHHGQRAEADDERDRCAQFAKSLGIPFVAGNADVPRLAQDSGVGLEEAGRNARYMFFESARQASGCDLVATAHTLDDHVETIVLNLVRGTGLAGLCGIPSRRDDIVRPMLPFTRVETRSYCTERGLWFHDDPSNADLKFARARVRQRIIPEFEAINPEVRDSFLRLSMLVADEESLLNGIAAAALEKSERPLNGELRFLTEDCEVAFDRSVLMAHPRPVVARGLRLACGVLGGSMDYTQTSGLVDTLAKDKGSWTLSGGSVVCEWDSDAVHLRRLDPTEPFRFPLTVPGETDSLEFGWTFSVLEVEAGSFMRKANSLDVVLDAAETKGPLHFRTAQPGDSVRPLGMSGTKKIAELFQQTGLTVAARKRLPIVCDMVGPVWVPGICLADRVRITDNSHTGLRLKLQPHSAYRKS